MENRFNLNMSIDLSGVYLTIGGKEILKNINLSFGEDTHVGIIGPNGCGKSCLLRIISTDLMPSKGTVAILGYRVGKTDLRIVRPKIGFVSQAVIEPNLRTDISIFELIATGLLGTYGLNEDLLYRDRSEETVRNMVVSKLQLLNINHLAERRYFACSSGERIRALIARALINNQHLLILDEPCNGLDIVQKQMFVNFLSSLHEYGVKTITVSHDWTDFHPNIKQMIAIKDGQVNKIGSREEILSKNYLEYLYGVTLPFYSYSIPNGS